MSPASRVCSAHCRLTTTITAHVSFMTASIAYHIPLAAGAGWCCTGPTLAIRRHELADEASALRAADEPPAESVRGSALARFVVAVMTPTNHRTTHPWSAQRQ